MKPVVLRALLLMLPLSYGLTLAWQEWSSRQARITAMQTVPAAVVVAPQFAAPDTLAVATVFGMAGQGSLLNSGEALTLRATVVTGDSDSRALLAGPDGARFYRTGERLPGGSLLRRIETHQVVVWRQGREALLSLHPAGVYFLQASQVRHPAASTVHLRPSIAQPISE